MRGAFLAIILAGVAGGCTTHDSAPLIFGQALTVGIAAGPSAGNPATPEIVLGVKSADIAIVPTVIPVSIEVPESQERRIHAFSEVSADGKEGKVDALSTFGSFESSTTAGEVGLGVFFATGVAAQNLSKGFGCAVIVAKNNSTSCPN